MMIKNSSEDESVRRCNKREIERERKNIRVLGKQGALDNL